MRTLALVVGVGRYADPAFSDTDAPVHGALAIASWLCHGNNCPAPADMKLFLSASPADAKANLQELDQAGVDIRWSADLHLIEDAIDELARRAKESGTECRLLLYWSGHGYSSLSGDRFWVCSNTTVENKRLLNGTALCRRLASIRSLRQQLVIVDTCAVHWDKLIETMPSRWEAASGIVQDCVFAAAEGDATRDAGETGLFTQIVLKALGVSDWLDRTRIDDEIIPALNDQDVRPYIVSLQYGRDKFKQLVAGPKPEGSPAWILDRCLDLFQQLGLGAVDWGPPFRAVLFDYGLGGASEAELADAIRRLSVLGTIAKGRISAALLQFMLRLEKNRDHAAEIKRWIDEGVTAKWIASSDVGKLRDQLRHEEPNRILVVELTNTRERVDGFTCRVQLRSGKVVSQTVKHPFVGWDAFGATLQDLCDKLICESVLQRDKFEYHFFIDLPLLSYPFHKIGGVDPLGQQNIVLLRYLNRRTYSTAMRSEVEAFLGGQGGTRLHPISSETPRADSAMGLYFTRFLVTAQLDRDNFRRLVQHLRDYNLPYVCWLHEASEDHSWPDFEAALARWLEESRSPDRFPEHLRAKRTDPRERHAEHLSLLWDDPSFPRRPRLESRL